MVKGFSPWTNQYRYGPIKVTPPSTVSSVSGLTVLVEYWKISASSGSTKKREKTAIRKENKIKGSFIESLTTNVTYPTNGIQGDYWYVKNGSAKKCYINKYVDKEVKSTYDVDNRVLQTKEIGLTGGRKSIRLSIGANSTAYNIYISQDRSNWIRIDDKTKLDGNNDIILPTTWSKISIKIETNGSFISRILLQG